MNRDQFIKEHTEQHHTKKKFIADVDALLAQQKESKNDDKIHYDSLKDCCNKLLDTVDNKKSPVKYVIGLKILLNR